MVAEGTACPCCGTLMEVEARAEKTLLRCPACGVTDLRLDSHNYTKIA